MEAPILNIFVPHTGHLPSVAGRPFFIWICFASLISRLVLHLTQYASAAVSYTHLDVYKRQDETWHFYRGDPIAIEVISPSGAHTRRILGSGDAFQTTIPAGAHFAAHVDAPDGYALVGCDVAPGFEFADFALTTRSMLTAAYPQHAPLIARYTR